MSEERSTPIQSEAIPPGSSFLQDRCRRCVVPRSLSSVAFREDGVCGLCLQFEKEQKESGGAGLTPNDIENVITEIRQRGQGSDYDCVVGVSGGRDSSYLLYLLTRKHQLRCLAVYYRTPFTHDVIDQNVRRMVQRLGVKLVEMPISQEKHRKVARYYCELWRRFHEPIVVNLACLVCKSAFPGLYRAADQYNVKSIVCGINKNEGVQYVPTLENENVAAHEDRFALWPSLVKSTRILKKGIHLLVRCPQVMRYLFQAAKASVLYLDPHTPYLRMRYSGIKSFEYFYHQSWSESECERIIQEELGWELPPGCWTTWRADCDFAELKNFMFYDTIGATYTDALYSNMIREGQITREEAMRRLAENPMFSRERMIRALEEMGLDLGFLNENRRDCRF